MGYGGPGGGGGGSGGGSGYRRVGEDRTANLKVNNITNRTGNSGTEVDGVIEAKGTHFVPPSGPSIKRFVTEDIVTDGLVAYYDAGNKHSYSGSGDTWYDLSDFKNSASLVSDPPHSTDFGGFIAFDGSADLASIGHEASPWRVNQRWFYGNARTYDYFVRCESNVQYLGGTNVNGGHGSGGVQLAAASTSPYFDKVETNDQISYIFTPTDPNADTRVSAHFKSSITSRWVHIVVSFNLSGHGLFNFYENGELLTNQWRTRGDAADANPTISYNQDANDQIAGGRFVNSQQFSEHDMAVVKIYNRMLSADEVKQNFDAHRSRFGL